MMWNGLSWSSTSIVSRNKSGGLICPMPRGEIDVYLDGTDGVYRKRRSVAGTWSNEKMLVHLADRFGVIPNVTRNGRSGSRITVNEQTANETIESGVLKFWAVDPDIGYLQCPLSKVL
jgi:hypothetical protein